MVCEGISGWLPAAPLRFASARPTKPTRWRTAKVTISKSGAAPLADPQHQHWRREPAREWRHNLALTQSREKNKDKAALWPMGTG